MDEHFKWFHGSCLVLAGLGFFDGLRSRQCSLKSGIQHGCGVACLELSLHGGLDDFDEVWGHQMASSWVMIPSSTDCGWFFSAAMSCEAVAW